MTDIVLISALRDETQDLFDDILTVVYSGVGKVNAALAAANAIEKYNPKFIINFGTAGSHKVEPHTLVDCNKFIQRDMHVKELGFDFGVTPFEEDVPRVLEFSSSGNMNMTCGTGDNFVASSGELECDVVDMEAYAIAKACYLSGVGFISYKYITDGASDDAAGQWQANCKKGAAKFLDVLAEISMSAQFFRGCMIEDE
jgi:adenosylhomocysteine nucleosidase